MYDISRVKTGELYLCDYIVCMHCFIILTALKWTNHSQEAFPCLLLTSLRICQALRKHSKKGVKNTQNGQFLQLTLQYTANSLAQFKFSFG